MKSSLGINIHSSLLISAASAGTLAVLLTIVPVQVPEKPRLSEPTEILSPSLELPVSEPDSDSNPKEKYFDVKAHSGIDSSFHEEMSSWIASGVHPSQSLKGSSRTIASDNFYNALWENESVHFGNRTYAFITPKLRVIALARNSQLGEDKEGKARDRILKSANPLDPNNHIPSMDTLEVAYSVSSLVDAVVKTGSPYSDRSDKKSSHYSMAGLSIRPTDMFSTGIVTGISTGAYGSRVDQPQLVAASNPFPVESFFVGRGTLGAMSSPNSPNSGRVIEWQANFRPVKNFLIQSSVLNKDQGRGEFYPELAKISMMLEFSKVVLNLRYSYLADPTNHALFKNGLVNMDTATLGLTMILDSAGNYSLFLGNNFYDMVASKKAPIAGKNDQSISSFTASFRGKTGMKNTIFFMNFRNQYARGIYFTDLGPYLIPTNAQSIYEYATSLGLELSF
ncbi:hypothetical protein CH373_06725 [Leptospira perolatii]|uniref:Uncharacterized protein n=1 Tax=Leptospira perolatii TaxID=2023191 RepID=A0A2M9ZP80_9LEPT|nr:hypothetical protein [Leptospira perolatii]PJZ70633.1 hypothetical protein CH360_03585 [Leptospira perolatii]PJZ73844.1 hypothetical protein CH373_06725 [Leptospira perolatii]